ncbi:MAG: hypothetical protein K940chlam8_00226 [Chlamydiae bacterium]|nr:hypothetical protein [Chlamydiota bacterium]
MVTHASKYLFTESQWHKRDFFEKTGTLLFLQKPFSDLRFYSQPNFYEQQHSENCFVSLIHEQNWYTAAAMLKGLAQWFVICLVQYGALFYLLKHKHFSTFNTSHILVLTTSIHLISSIALNTLFNDVQKLAGEYLLNHSKTYQDALTLLQDALTLLSECDASLPEVTILNIKSNTYQTSNSIELTCHDKPPLILVKCTLPVFSDKDLQCSDGFCLKIRLPHLQKGCFFAEVFLGTSHRFNMMINFAQKEDSVQFTPIYEIEPSDTIPSSYEVSIQPFNNIENPKSLEDFYMFFAFIGSLLQNKQVNLLSFAKYYDSAIENFLPRKKGDITYDKIYSKTLRHCRNIQYLLDEEDVETFYQANRDTQHGVLKENFEKFFLFYVIVMFEIEPQEESFSYDMLQLFLAKTTYEKAALYHSLLQKKSIYMLLVEEVLGWIFQAIDIQATQQDLTPAEMLILIGDCFDHSLVDKELVLPSKEQLPKPQDVFNAVYNYFENPEIQTAFFKLLILWKDLDEVYTSMLDSNKDNFVIQLATQYQKLLQDYAYHEQLESYDFVLEFLHTHQNSVTNDAVKAAIKTFQEESGSLITFFNALEN